jgi:hypothetical protein
MRIKLRGLPLCKAGDWGLQTPEKCLCFGFFAAKPQKNRMGKTLVQKSSLIGVFPGAKHQTCLLWYFFDFVEKIPQQRGFLEDFVPQAPILYATFAHTEKNQNKKGFGASPQWEIRVSLMRMGSVQAIPPSLV